jgi:GcrA cell cycle regulator
MSRCAPEFWHKPPLWDQAKTEELIKLWADGFSTREIAIRLNTTKNAIVGKKKRLALQDRPSPIAYGPPRPPIPSLPYVMPPPKPKTGRPPGPSRHVAPIPPEWLVEPPPAPRPTLVPPSRPVSSVVPFKQHAGPCRWPLGDPRKPGFRFCDGRAVLERPYCERHCEKAYVKREEKHMRLGT